MNHNLFHLAKSIEKTLHIDSGIWRDWYTLKIRSVLNINLFEKMDMHKQTLFKETLFISMKT